MSIYNHYFGNAGPEQSLVLFAILNIAAFIISATLEIMAHMSSLLILQIGCDWVP